MMGVFIKKEINNFLKSKIVILFTFLFSALIAYSFYSAVSLYSKASVSALGNPLYASGFEPISGVFVPTFGGFFILLSLIAPFLFIRVLSDEKKNNTLALLVQFPISFEAIFIFKLLASFVFLLIFIVFLFPLFWIWYSMGGHLPFSEILLLVLGYFLYGMFVISVSLFSSAIFDQSAQSSMAALSLVLFSWFVDFGKDMNISPFLNELSRWSITKQLKYFENGILSVQSVFYFVLLILFFSFLAYFFFNFSIKDKIKALLGVFCFFMVLFYLNTRINLNFDLTESRKNSFSYEKTKFLRKLPKIEIDVFLEPTDSRAKDYMNDFFKKLKLVKGNVCVRYAEGRQLEQNYGIFKYTIQGKSERTFSNSEEEIFMILEKLSGIKIDRRKEESFFKGYPLIAKKGWAFSVFIFYLILLPLGILFFYFRDQIIYRNRIN